MESAEALSTALVRRIGFSKPIVTTKNGSPSDSRITLIGTPSLVVTKRPNRKAKTPEKRTVVANQNLEPILLIEKNKETKLRCIEMYPRAMITMSMVSACCKLVSTELILR